jgi:hypothetical protein
MVKGGDLLQTAGFDAFTGGGELRAFRCLQLEPSG